MRKFFLFLLLLILLTSCVKEEISPQELEEKSVVLSMHKIVLEPLQSQDFFVGLKNEFSENMTFYVSAVCRTNNCDNNIIVQTFPLFSLGPEKSGAFPIRVEALENSQKGNYTVNIVVKQDNRTYDSDEFTIEIPRTIEEVKESALKRIFR